MIESDFTGGGGGGPGVAGTGVRVTGQFLGAMTNGRVAACSLLLMSTAVRVRPLSTREIARHEKCIVSIDTNRVALQQPGASGELRSWTYDHAFFSARAADVTFDERLGRCDAPFADQETVYRALGQDIVSDACRCVCVCVCACLRVRMCLCVRT